MPRGSIASPGRRIRMAACGSCGISRRTPAAPGKWSSTGCTPASRR